MDIVVAKKGSPFRTLEQCHQDITESIEREREEKMRMQQIEKMIEQMIEKKMDESVYRAVESLRVDVNADQAIENIAELKKAIESLYSTAQGK